ncbi:MAG: STAS domain-containing protein [Sphingomonadales bacterium]|nr:STAS domain-containing protein [Sphingomonadales bacterium]
MTAITLPARCDRAAAEALLPEFQSAQGSGVLHIDASQTTQIGQAMLQLLVAARRGSDGAVIVPGPAVLDAARLTGLESLLFDSTYSEQVAA